MLFVVSKGIPHKIVSNLRLSELQAYCIILSELELPEEQHFDFQTMRFREPKK